MKTSWKSNPVSTIEIWCPSDNAMSRHEEQGTSEKWLPPSPGQEVLGWAREVMPEAGEAVRPQATGVLSHGTGANGAPSGHRWDNLSIMKMNENLIFWNYILKYYRGDGTRSEICFTIMERGVLRSMWWQRWHKINYERKLLKLTEVHIGSLY